MTNEEIAVKFEDHEHEIKSLKHRMEKSEKQQETLHQMATSVEKMAVNMEHMAKEQAKQGERLERLEHEPADDFKHYKRLIIGCIITGVLSAIVGAVLALIL
jgi:hypothetical protein